MQIKLLSVFLSVALLTPACATTLSTGRTHTVGPGAGPGSASPPPTAAPEEPPPPPEQTPGAPAAQAQASPPAGQWVYTQQYGWLWMPQDDRYTFWSDYEYGDPYMYVYYPRIGWTWVAAPWLWGWGPVPWFGPGAGVYYHWAGNDWGHHWTGHRPSHSSPFGGHRHHHSRSRGHR